MNAKSQHYDAFASVVKITLRDGDASEEERRFLQIFAKKIGITSSEYFSILENYMRHKIVAPYTYEERIDALYKITEIIHEEKGMLNTSRIIWLERMAIAMGFDPSYANGVVVKSLHLIKYQTNLDTYKEGIENLIQ